MPISSNFAQMFPWQTPNSKTQKITWFWGRMRGLCWQKFHKQFPWIIYLHCHPIIIIIQLDRFGKNNSTSGICKSMRIHAVMSVHVLGKRLERKFPGGHLMTALFMPLLFCTRRFFCVHRTRFNDIAFSCTCQARDWKNHRPPTGYLQVLRISDSNINPRLIKALLKNQNHTSLHCTKKKGLYIIWTVLGQIWSTIKHSIEGM